MDINSFKQAFEKAKGNNLVVFLFFLLVSCSLWLSMTLNRVYETDICVSVRVKNIPEGVALEDEDGVSTHMVLSGEGTALFGYLFDDAIEVDVNYSDFYRRGGRLAMPTASIRSRVVEKLGPSLSLKNFLADSVVAQVKRVTAVVPVKKNRLDLKMADGCELVSIGYEPEVVTITALVDEVADIKEVRTPVLTCEDIQCDTILELIFLPGRYIDVKPKKVQVKVDVSRYVKGSAMVPVEYVGFPSDIDLGFLPQEVEVDYEVLESDAGKVRPFDFSVRLLYDDYAYSVAAGAPSELERRFAVTSASPFVRNAAVVGGEVPDTASNTVNI